MIDVTNFFAPKVQKVDLGLPERAKTSYTYAKVRLGRFGSAKVQKVQLFALFALWRSRTAQAALLHTCTTFLLDLGSPKPLLALLERI